MHTSAGVTPGLFPIRATGVSTAPIVDAATKFLATLTPAQTIRTIFAVDDAEWRRWSNVDNGIYTRQGISLREMSGPQRDAAMALLRASLSAKGVALSLDIMKTDQVLREVNDDALRYDEQLYFFTMMGRPSATEPWGWQIDGHHLIVNYFVLGDQVVMTPVFMGGEPVVATTGKYAGNAVMQAEQDQGLAFMRALAPVARQAATLRPDKPANDIQAQADSDNVVLEYRGVKASSLPAAQKTQLLALAGLFVGNLRDEHAAGADERSGGAPRRHVVRVDRRHERRRGVLLPHPQPGHPDRVRPPAAGGHHQDPSTRSADPGAHPYDRADTERQRLRQGSVTAAPRHASALTPGRRRR